MSFCLVGYEFCCHQAVHIYICSGPLRSWAGHGSTYPPRATGRGQFTSSQSGMYLNPVLNLTWDMYTAYLPTYQSDVTYTVDDIAYQYHA